jgi:hypothetical protein
MSCDAVAEVLDIVCSGTTIAGVERVRFDQMLLGTPLTIAYMPWTHSLPAAIAWGVRVFVVAGRLFRLALRAVLALSLVTFSHFPLDYFVHRRDLSLGFGASKPGLALCNKPALEEIVGPGCLALAAAAWGWWRDLLRLPAAGALGFSGLLVAVPILSVTAPLIADPVGFGVFGRVIYFGSLAVAALIDRSDNDDNRDAA